MPTVRLPRSGSMQYWPRKRAKRVYARIRTFPTKKEQGLMAFAGYKVGMTHILATETRKTSHLKGEEISIPVTILECPPLKIGSVRFYKKTNTGMKVAKEIILYTSKDKELGKRLRLPKKNVSQDLASVIISDFSDIRVVVYTQPKLTGIGKKKPEFFELSLGGSIEDKFSYVKENASKEILFENVFKEGETLDIKAVTKGKGFQGPVKRFGISLRQSKSEKSIRNPGSLGPWCGQGHIMWRVAHAGKMGYHQRTEHNKQIMKIIKDAKEMSPKGGYLKYGVIKNNCVLVKGSVAGPRQRIIIMQKPIKPVKAAELPTVNEINRSEKQGN